MLGGLQVNVISIGINSCSKSTRRIVGYKECYVSQNEYIFKNNFFSSLPVDGESICLKLRLYK